MNQKLCPPIIDKQIVLNILNGILIQFNTKQWKRADFYYHAIYATLYIYLSRTFFIITSKWYVIRIGRAILICMFFSNHCLYCVHCLFVAKLYRKIKLKYISEKPVWKKKGDYIWKFSSLSFYESDFLFQI